ISEDETPVVGQVVAVLGSRCPVVLDSDDFVDPELRLLLLSEYEKALHDDAPVAQVDRRRRLDDRPKVMKLVGPLEAVVLERLRRSSPPHPWLACDRVESAGRECSRACVGTPRRTSPRRRRTGRRTRPLCTGRRTLLRSAARRLHCPATAPRR